MDQPPQQETRKAIEASIPKLVSALAAAARASNQIPTSSNPNNSNNENEDDNDSDNSETNDQDDEFAYQWSFPEFASSICEARTTVLQIIGDCLQHAHDNDELSAEELINNVNVEFDWDHQETIVTPSSSNVGLNIWNECFDCQESLLDEVERYLQSDGSDAHNKQKLQIQQGNSSFSNSSHISPKRKGGLHSVISNTVEMEKPQSAFSFFEYDNSRTNIWKPPNMKESDLPDLIQGHGLRINDRNTTTTTNTSTTTESNDNHTILIAPPMRYPHPYQNLIETFSYNTEQLTLPTIDTSSDTSTTTLMKPMNPDDTCHFIDTEQQLEELSKLIQTHDITLIAVDLEHHSYRSFHGFTCLMQISIRLPGAMATTTTTTNQDTQTQTYLIDTIRLRPFIYKHLSPYFHSPKIVKVMHGAKSDVKWLQRDFGIYVINLFDTGIASRLLKLPSAAMAYLLKKYAGLNDIDIWKQKYQLGDWRVRPLPEEMKLYAMGDTHYLLDIYDVLRIELVKKKGGGKCDSSEHDNNTKDDSTRAISITSVLDASRQISLIRYTKDPFNPNGYQRLIDTTRSKRLDMKSKRVQSRFTPTQTKLLASLWDWRDATARLLDESLFYICNDKALLRISMAMPQSVNVLQGLWNPMPVIIMRFAETILELVKKAKHSNSSSSNHDDDDSTKIALESSLKKKPNEIPTKASHLFYIPLKEAEQEEESKQDDIVNISACNAEYCSSRYSNHSLEMRDISTKTATPSLEEFYHRSQTVDGLGAARAALSISNEQEQNVQGNNNNDSIEMEVQKAQISAENVRRNLLGLIKKWNPKLLSDGSMKKNDDSNKEMEIDVKHAEDQNTQNDPFIRHGKRRANPSLQKNNQINNNTTSLSLSTTKGTKKQKKEVTNSNNNNNNDDDVTAKTNRGQKKEASPIVPFDYSAIKPKGIFNSTSSASQSSSSNNPFFAGAALGLGSITNPVSTKEKRGGIGSAKKNKGKGIKDNQGNAGNKEGGSPPKTEHPKRDRNKMLVYRTR